MEKIEYHLYELLRDGLSEDKFSKLSKDEKNWVLIDKSNKEKVMIRSGKRIDDLLAERGISYTYYGLRSFERKEIPILD